ncbi:hypothetical protein C7S20_08130 [Christiangramia fulva]|uniref:Multidrug transporter n=1 Tax=Christiangramia fulva TaxID=2126553 RepID=A0A2R3Z4P9_9FLAO|nr:hypothetical protein [Christiangramia fulva]AVR45239.1 hypothetical protein C7S20_08130 [Christiangramia fulva]
MRKLLISGFAIFTLAITGCSTEDAPQVATCSDGIKNGDETGVDCGGSCVPCNTNGGGGGNETGDVTLTGLITKDSTLTSNRIWVLSGKVVIDSGVELTIEPGTIIKGKEGTGSLASALIISRGAKINAQGTSSKPIIFTSINDNITVGQTTGTNLDENDRGLWGGVLLLGKAPISIEGDATEGQIEGIPADDTFGRYGGTDPQDNSGIFQYVSIRHGGALIGEGNEINGLSLGGVGSGTTVDHVEVVGNLDDGFEFFGGTVNPSSLLAYKGGDDGLDVDQAYSGTITNSVVVQGPISDHGLEIDGPEGTATGSFTMDGITVFGDATNTGGGAYADLRDSSMGTIKNALFLGFSATQEFKFKDAGTSENYTNGVLNFENFEIVLPGGITAVGDIFNDTSGLSTLSADAATFATAIPDAGSATVGADLSEFTWTYAKNHNAF